MKTSLSVLILLFIILLPACNRAGPKLGKVEGIVTFDGQPLPGAVVIFEPKAGGHASRAVTDASGNYQMIYLRDIQGALVGTHIVKIFTASEDNPKERVPVRYNKKSTMRVEVVRGKNEHNFVLTSK